MTDILSEVALRRLAQSLYRAGDERLYKLFEDDRWLLRRVAGEERDWGGFQEDLDLGVDYALSTDASPSFKIGKLLRLGIIRSTLSSADAVPLNIIVAAVNSGTWSIERAIATITRYAAPEKQVEAYAKLVETGLQASLDPIYRALVATAFGRPNQIPAGALIGCVHLLPEPDQAVLADRLAAACELYPTSRHSRSAETARGMKVLRGTDILKAMSIAPSTRTPALVRKTVDALIEEGTRISDGAFRWTAPALVSSLEEAQRRDMAEILFGDYTARLETLSALTLAAEFVDAYPEPTLIQEMLAKCVGCAATAEEWADLSSPFGNSLETRGVEWRPPAFIAAARYESPEWQEEQNRLFQFRQILLRTNQVRRDQMYEGEQMFTVFSLEQVQHTWISLALRRLRQPDVGSDEDPDSGRDEGRDDNPDRGPDSGPEVIAPQVDQVDDPHELLVEHLQVIMRPTLMAMAIAQADLPVTEVGSIIPEMYDLDSLPLQLFTLKNSVDDERVDAAIGRYIMGELLRYALEQAHEGGASSSAWADIDGEVIEASDLSPVVEYIRTLPIEEERTYASDLFNSLDLDERDVPFLNVLSAVAPHLDGANANRLGSLLLESATAAVRNRGLDLLAPRLTQDMLRKVLNLDWKQFDARELVWFFSEVASTCSGDGSNTRRIEARVFEVAGRIEDGWAYVDAILHRSTHERFSAAVAVANPTVLATVAKMSPNNRSDALIGLSSHANRDAVVPAAVFDEILRLPVENSTSQYSWRGVGLISAAMYLDSTMATQALDAAMELPEVLKTGSSEAWDRDWTNEYMRAAALNALVPKLDADGRMRVFSYAVALPFRARDPLFRRLAEHADRRLALELFDASVDIFATYMKLPNSQAPFAVDGSVSMQPSKIFKMRRQVEFSELIELLLPHLDEERLVSAGDLAIEFSATGPCAWLGGRLLSRLSDSDRVDAELLTSMALVDAYSYVGQDPSRIDVLIDLLPYVRKHAEINVARLAGFVADRFPGYSGEFLDEEHGKLLDSDGMNEYLALSGIGPMLRFQSEAEGDLSEVELRYLAAAWYLSPVAERNRGEFLVRILDETPINSRLRALPRLQEILPEELCLQAYEYALARLLSVSHELDAEAFGELAKILEVLPQPYCDRLIGLLEHAPGFSGTIGEAAHAVFGEVYHDLGRALNPHPRYQSYGRSIAAEYIGKDIEQKAFQKAFAFRTPRVAFLVALVNHLSADGLVDALLAIETFSDLEKGEAWASILTVPTGQDYLRRICDSILALGSPFAKLWALSRCATALEEFSDECERQAEGIVRSFSDPEDVGASAALLGGLLPSGAFSTIIQQLEVAGDDESSVKLLSLAARFCADEDQQEVVLGRVVSIGSTNARYRGMLMLARLGFNLVNQPAENVGEWVSTITDRLVQLANLPRTEHLRTLAGEMPLLGIFLNDDEKGTLVDDVLAACIGWRWP